MTTRMQREKRIESPAEFNDVMSTLVNHSISTDRTGYLATDQGRIRNMARQLLLHVLHSGALTVPSVGSASAEVWATLLSEAMEIRNVAGSPIADFRAASSVVFPTTPHERVRAEILPPERVRTPFFVAQRREARALTEEQLRHSQEAARLRDRQDAELVRLAYGLDTTLHRGEGPVSRQRQAVLAEAREKMAEEIEAERREAERRLSEGSKVRFLRKVDLD